MLIVTGQCYSRFLGQERGGGYDSDVWTLDDYIRSSCRRDSDGCSEILYVVLGYSGYSQASPTKVLE